MFMEWLVPIAVAFGLVMQAWRPLVTTKPSWAKELRFHAFFAAIVLLQVYVLQRIDPIFPASGQLRLEWVVAALLALDLVSYVWHRLNHRVQWLWRWHSFHHRAESLDALAAFRFHPIEVFLGYQLRAIAVFLIGLNAAELAVFVSLFGLMNVLQHSGIRIPRALDDLLSWVIVTPRRHHVHHYKSEAFHGSNFSTVFIFWDRLFGTYKEPLSDTEINLGLSNQD